MGGARSRDAMWRRKVPLGVQPEPHPRGYEIRIPIRGYDVRVDRETIVYDEVRVRVRPTVSRPRRFRVRD
jgi:hypothetical protein